MWTSQGCGPSTRITLSASAVTEERSEFITRTGSPWISPSWFSQSAGYFSRSERVRASKSLDIRAPVAHEVSIKMRSAARTRRGFLRCMLIPSQQPASSRLIASMPSSTRRMEIENLSGTETGFLRPMCPISVPDTFSLSFRAAPISRPRSSRGRISFLIPGFADQRDGQIHIPDARSHFFAHPVHAFRSLTHGLGIADPLESTVDGRLYLWVDVDHSRFFDSRHGSILQ